MLRSIVSTLLIAACSLAYAVPFWGARESSSADTPPADLKPGEWIWGGDNKAMGPMAVIVSITEQRAYVYRNGVLVAVSTPWADEALELHAPGDRDAVRQASVDAVIDLAIVQITRSAQS